MKHFMLWILTCAFLLGVCCASAETAEKEITVMVYMAGSDLESSMGQASADIMEMIHSGFEEEQINLLIMAGGAKNWTLGFDPDMITIVQGTSERRGVRQIQTYPSMNMGEAESLSLFLRYGVENFPAKTYSLILWGHGGGPAKGVCYDEIYDHDCLTVKELVSAFSDSPFSTRKLVWIGFDADLSCSAEMATMLAPYADYLIAPQGMEFAGGWDYSFLKGLEKDGNGAETGKRIIDAYFNAHSREIDTHSFTSFACVDLSGIKDVEASLDDMFKTLTDQFSPPAYELFTSNHPNGFDTDQWRKWHDDNLTDLLSLCTSFSSENPDGAALVESAVKKAVVCVKSDDDTCSGLLVFFPSRRDAENLDQWLEIYRDLDFCPGYTKYLETISNSKTEN